MLNILNYQRIKETKDFAKNDKNKGGNPSSDKYNVYNSQADNNTISDHMNFFSKKIFKGKSFNKKISIKKNTHCFNCGQENELRGLSTFL
jgi:hypothetical protein